MDLRLRLLLFYFNHITKKINYNSIDPNKLRALDEEEVQKKGFIIDYPPISMERVTDEFIEARDKTKIPIRIYTPTKSTKLKTMVYFHGGGFVSYSINTHDKICRRLAATNQARVISVGYRLAPEHKFPIPLHDCYDAALAIYNNYNNEPLTLLGDSAGGNLALSAALQNITTKQFEVKNLILIYPTVDARMNHPSLDKYDKKYFLTKERIKWYRDQYITKPSDVFNPLVSPILHPDLSKLPPTLIITAGLDPLLDEALEIYKKIKLMDVDAHYIQYESVIHGFINMPRIIRSTSKQFQKDVNNFFVKYS